MRLFDPEEEADEAFRYRHFAIAADTALWDGFVEALGHALRTTDLARLKAFFRGHEGAANRVDAARRSTVEPRDFLEALDGAERTLTQALSALDAHDPVNGARLAEAAQARTHSLPQLRALATGGSLEFPRAAWMKMAALPRGKVAGLVALRAPQLMIGYEICRVTEALDALLRPAPPGGPFGWFEDSAWTRDDGEPPPDALQRLQSAADCCLDLCVGDWAPNGGLGAAVQCLGPLDDDSFDARPRRAAHTAAQGVHLDFVELGFEWFSVSPADDALCVASGDELARFIEKLERPFDLREAWSQHLGDDGFASLDEGAEDLGFASFAAAERLFVDRLARFRTHCRALHEQGRTLLVWTRRSRWL